MFKCFSGWNFWGRERGGVKYQPRVHLLCPCVPGRACAKAWLVLCMHTSIGLRRSGVVQIWTRACLWCVGHAGACLTLLVWQSHVSGRQAGCWPQCCVLSSIRNSQGIKAFIDPNYLSNIIARLSFLALLQWKLSSHTSISQKMHTNSTSVSAQQLSPFLCLQSSSCLLCRAGNGPCALVLH